MLRRAMLDAGSNAEAPREFEGILGKQGPIKDPGNPGKWLAAGNPGLPAAAACKRACLEKQSISEFAEGDKRGEVGKVNVKLDGSEWGSD